ncbi:MAG: ATP-binding cassette domain-containing protein, partial [Paraperlucidibaca sp.]
MSEIVLATHALGQQFSEGPQAITVLSDVSFQVARGERVAIVGRSGSGKTTLLHLLGGLELPNSGRVELMGKDLASLSETQRSQLRNQHIGFVYQLHHLLPEFTALENVSLPAVIGGMRPAQAREKARALLARVGLADRVEHKPSELS